MAKRVVTILCVLLAGRALGAEVIGVSSNRRNIAIKHESIGRWNVDDVVCVMQASIDVVCGKVIKATSKGAIVKLDTTFDGLSIGDVVRKAGTGRKIAATTTAKIEDTRSSRAVDLTLGAGVGPTFFFPFIAFQVALGQSFALGLSPFYYRSAADEFTVSAIGGFLTANYYTDGYFRGLWAQIGAGLNYLSVGSTGTVAVSESKATTALLATGGWRGRWGNMFNVGIAAGVQYTSDPLFTSVDIKSAGVQPIVMVDFGFTF